MQQTQCSCAMCTESACHNVIELDAAIKQSAGIFIAASAKAIQEISTERDVLAVDNEIEQIRAEEAEAALRSRESAYYRLIRRAFVCQANGDFELGHKLQEIMREIDEPTTETEFDSCMARALAAMPIL